MGEGTLQLNRIQGYFEYLQTDTEATLRTERMTVGEVVLVPAQYVIDGGDIDSHWCKTVCKQSCI